MGYYISSYDSFGVTPPMNASQRMMFMALSLKLKDWDGTWTISQDGKSLSWEQDIGKSYPNVHHLIWLLQRFFKPRKIVLSGRVEYQGDNEDDCGEISVVSGRPIVTGSMAEWWETWQKKVGER